MSSVVSRRLFTSGAVAAAAGLVAACSSPANDAVSRSDSSSGAAGDAALTPVTVGLMPILDVAPIYLGIRKGFFATAGLDVRPELAQGGAVIIPSVVSGQYHFGFSNTTSLLIAAAKKIPVKVVGSGSQAQRDPQRDYGAIAVPAGSPIKSAKDLAGKKVAVNTLKNINTTTINKLVRDDGADPATVQYVELGYPDIAAAITKGDVDAGQLVEPFLTFGTGAGLVSIGSNYAAVAPQLQVAMFFTSTSYQQTNPTVVASFTEALNTALRYANEHPDEAREVVTSYTKIDAATAAKVTLPVWSDQITTDSVSLLAQLGVADKLFPTAPDIAALLP